MPNIWTDMTDQDNIKVVPLKSSDQEFKKIVTEFQKTAGNQQTVIKV